MAAIEEFIQQAIEYVRRGQAQQARRLVEQTLRQHPRNARAWYLLSLVVSEPYQAIDCLKRVLALDPGNPYARQRLNALQPPPAGLPHLGSPRTTSRPPTLPAMPRIPSVPAMPRM